MSSGSDVCEELGGSELGTLSYWEKIYTEEINNFNDHGDVGEVWFGEDSLLRAVEWIVKCDAIKKEDPVVDIGCGNGMSLLELGREGFTNLLGIDYSKAGVDLASNVCNKEFPNINFKVVDFLSDDIDEFVGVFKVVHDKGTYDAISLHREDPKSKRSTYIQRVYEILQNGGYFIITSCNWTECELRNHFGEKFQLKKVIPTPQFRFGGKIGNVVTAIVFEKKV